MRGRFDELALRDTALGREDLAAQFREAAEELGAEFEAASDDSHASLPTPKRLQ
jgi:hypothetical protein